MLRNGMLLAILALAAPALAQPEVLSADGTLSAGESFVLNGSNFGVKSPAAPLAWDDFESGTESARLLDRDAGGVFDIQSSETRRPTYSSALGRYAGDMCALQDFDERSNKSMGLQGMDLDTLYISAWTYRDDYAGTATNSLNQKLWGNWSGFDLTDPVIFTMPQSRFDTYWGNGGGHLFANDCNGTNIVNNWGTGGPTLLNEWFRLERFMAIGDLNGGNGYSYAKADLQFVGEIQGNFHTCANTYENWSIGNYFQKDNGAVLRVFNSEMYIDNTRARIEIGDAPVWSQCTHREIQIPESWDGSRLAFRVNPGTFADDDQAFVFVVNEQGQPSAGYPVIIGARHVSGDQGPPGQPGQPRLVP